MFNNKSILITGGTGSFGKAFIHHVLNKYNPSRLIVFSRDELKQSEMQQSIDSEAMRYFLGDVRDQERLELAMQGVDIVVHAAALKQITAAEYNPMECIKTNINGAENIIKAALKTGVEKVIALSTDKAVNPVNLYGATKLASDKLFIAANNVVGYNKTQFSVVRYGNVIGSRGSVIPLYQKMASENVKSLPITDTRMTRFWITLQQGVEFVEKSLTRMLGGEIFVPKIPSAHITEIAKAIGPKLDTHVVGIRPGEKLHEAMCPLDDSHLTIEFKDHYVIRPAIVFFEERDFQINAQGESGETVPSGFSYESGTNPHFLTAEEIRQLIDENHSVR